jgi:Uma2 family endonuclease
MVTTAKSKRVQAKNRGQDFQNKTETYLNSCRWPRDIDEAYKRGSGPYNVQNAITLLEEEPLELFNGWLVWKPMTDPEERRIGTIILEILSSTARTYGFGQAYMDLFECMMANGDELKPDLCILSNQRFENQVAPAFEGSKHLVLKGSPELAIELRSPSNLRSEERIKRQKYFNNGTLIVWDVEPKKRKIWVYEVENPQKATEYGESDTITCERLFPGWKRLVADFFSKELTAEDIVGEAAKQWRAESEAIGLAKGREEGLAQGREDGELETLRRVLIRQSHRRFGAERLPKDFEVRLNRYNVKQLTDLTDGITTSLTLEEWLTNFPV